MTREDLIDQIRAHEDELRALGVLRLSLFGSMARGEGGDDSDVDLLAAFDDERDLSLLDVVHIELRLAEWIGRRVDLVEEGRLKPRVQESVNRDLVRAF